MDNQPLGILSWGTYLPPAKPVKDLVLAAKADPTNYLSFGWPTVLVAGENEHPLYMTCEALKKALADANLEPAKLSLIICTTETHDYKDLSSAMEIMREMNLPSTSIGFDLYQDCMATVTAMDVAKNWLQAKGGGYAAIVSGERFCETMDRGDKTFEVFWGFGDGASALIVGLGVPDKPRLQFMKSSFFTKSSQNGYAYRLYGGTRNPVAPAGEVFKRRPPHISNDSMFQSYLRGYDTVLTDIKKHYPKKPSWIVCSQTSPGIITMLSSIAGVKESAISVTGHKYGHIGCSDIVMGIEDLFLNKKLNGDGVIAACCSAGWCAAYLAGTST